MESSDQWLDNPGVRGEPEAAVVWASRGLMAGQEVDGLEAGGNEGASSGIGQQDGPRR